MIDPTRLTTIKAAELDLGVLYQMVASDGHAGQLLGWDVDANYVYLILGPAQSERRILVSAQSDIQILDAPEPRKSVGHWGA